MQRRETKEQKKVGRERGTWPDFQSCRINVHLKLQTFAWRLTKDRLRGLLFAHPHLQILHPAAQQRSSRTRGTAAVMVSSCTNSVHTQQFLVGIASRVAEFCVPFPSFQPLPICQRFIDGFLQPHSRSCSQDPSACLAKWR